MENTDKITRHECRKVPVRVAHLPGGKYVHVGDLARVLEVPAQALRRYASHAPVKVKGTTVPAQVRLLGVQVAIHAAHAEAMVTAVTVRGDEQRAALERNKKTVVGMLQRVLGAAPKKAPSKPAKGTG